MSKDTIAERVAEKVKRACVFEKILSAFEEEFGRNRIQFELFNYDSEIGIAVANGDPGAETYARIAIRFSKNDGPDVLQRALKYAKSWTAGQTKYKGVIGDDVLEGRELCSRKLAA